MKTQLKSAAAILLPILLFSACQKELEPAALQEEISTARSGYDKLKNDELELQITGLEDLGTSARYEGWVINDEAPVSTGVFTVNGAGQMSQTVFEVPATSGKLKRATAFVLTIEPFPDNNPAPSDQHLLPENLYLLHLPRQT